MRQWMGGIRCLMLLGLLMLAGCASQGPISGGEDETGALGAERRDSPATLYVQMGIAYLNEGQPAVALQKLKMAISLDPDNAEEHNVIAILYERLGNTKLAEKHYTQAAMLDPRDPYIRNARGSFFCKQERFAQAQSEFESALSNPLYSTPWVAMTNAGLCAERGGDPEKAENYYRRALTVNDNYFQALLRMAELSHRQGNHLSARGYLERYNGVAEPSAASLWLGVRIERSLDDRQRAHDYGKELLEKFPDAPEVQKLRRAGW